MHSFYTAPSIGLTTSILDLCSSPLVSAAHADTIAHEVAAAQLCASPEALAGSDSALEKALEAAGLVVELLDYAQLQLASAAAPRWMCTYERLCA